MCPPWLMSPEHFPRCPLPSCLSMFVPEVPQLCYCCVWRLWNSSFPLEWKHYSRRQTIFFSEENPHGLYHSIRNHDVCVHCQCACWCTRLLRQIHHFSLSRGIHVYSSPATNAPSLHRLGDYLASLQSPLLPQCVGITLSVPGSSKIQLFFNLNGS